MWAMFVFDCFTIGFGTLSMVACATMVGKVALQLYWIKQAKISCELAVKDLKRLAVDLAVMKHAITKELLKATRTK